MTGRYKIFYRTLQVMFVLLFSLQMKAQNLNTSGSVTFSIGSGTVVKVGSINHANVATIDNAGTLVVSSDFTNAGTIQGNGLYQIAGSLTNSGTFTCGTSTVKFNGSSSQTIPALNYYNLDLSSATGGITLTNTGTIGIAGSLTGATVAMTVTGSTVLFNGSAAQSITGTGTTAFNNLLINNSNGVTVSTTAITIADALSITGSLTNSSGTITLLSTATKTARVLQGSSSGNYLVGNVNVQRYIKTKTGTGGSYGNRKFWFIAAPIGNSTTSFSSTWQQQIHITGPGTGGSLCAGYVGTGNPTTNSNGFDATVQNANSILKFDDTQPFTNTKWQGIASTTGDFLKPGEGYRVLIRGPRTQGCDLLNAVPNAANADVTLSFTAPVKQGDFSYTLPATGLNQFNLIGNPYPAELNFDLFRLTNTGIYNNYWTYYPKNAAGNYTAYNNGTTTNMTDSSANNVTVIASGQSFFVENKASNPSLQFQEAHKSTKTKYGLFGPGDIPVWEKIIRITMQDTAKSNLDEVVVRFGTQVSEKNLYDREWDSYSLNSGDQLIQSLKQDTLPMAIQTRNGNFINDTVHLNIQSVTDGKFSLNFTEFDQTKYADIYLLDNFTKTVQKVNDKPQYDFSINTANPKSQGKTRFTLLFKLIGSPSAVLLPDVNPVNNPGSDLSIITTYPNPVGDILTVNSSNPIAYYKMVNSFGSIAESLTNEFGNASTTKQLKLNVSNLRPGYYFLQIVDTMGRKATKKIIKQ